MNHISSPAHTEQTSPDQLLRQLAKEFIHLNREMGSIPSEQNRNAIRSDQLVDAQSEIIRNALDVQALDVSGVLAKISIWVADAPDLSRKEELSRYDAILLSAYSDLANLGAEGIEE